MELLGMRIGYHSLSWDWGRDIYTAISEIAALGFSGTETFASTATWDDAELLKLEQHLQKENLKLPALYYDGALGHPGQRSLHVSAVEAAAKLLQRLGGEVMVIGGGHPQVIEVDGQQVPMPREREEMARTLDRMGQVCAQYGITLALHPHRGCICFDEESIDDILAMTDPDLVRFCPDTAHLAMAGMDPVAMITKYADRIAHVHLKDYEGQEFRGIGKGHLDIKGVFDALNDSGYDGWVMIELDDQDQQKAKAQSSYYAVKGAVTGIKGGN